MEVSFELISSLAQLNVAYLGVTLGALALILGGLYLFSISPLRETLKKQEKSLSDLKHRLTRKIEKIENETLKTIKLDFDHALENSKKVFQGVFRKDLDNTKNQIKDEKAELLKEVDNKIEKFKDSDISFVREALVNNEKILRENEKALQERLDNLKTVLNKTNLEISDLKYKVRELEAYKFSKEGRMGAIIAHVDLLETDLKDKRWRLEHRLNEIKGELFTTDIGSGLATKLRELLKQVTEEGLKELVAEVEKLIIISKPI